MVTSADMSPSPPVFDNDVLVRIRACGVSGSDTFYLSIGGPPTFLPQPHVVETKVHGTPWTNSANDVTSAPSSMTSGGAND